MGKGTDKLYITHSEWSSSDAYSPSVGAGAASSRNAKTGVPFRKLPFNFCAASLQPFQNPVCTPDGTIFDVEVIGAWLEKHPNQNPVDGAPLQKRDLIRLSFARNAASDSRGAGLGDDKGDLVDPVTYKVFTDNTHIVAVRHGTYANVFAWDTVERMNVKAKMWRDLLDDEPFTRADIITLQDPHNAARRSLDQFKYLRDGAGAQRSKDQEEEEERARAEGGINAGALGSMGDKVLRARAAVDKARKAREAGGDVNRSAGTALAKTGAAGPVSTAARESMIKEKKLAAMAAAYTTGRAAASFTSTGLTPETSGARALLTDEEFMLKPKRVTSKGYARLETNLGDLTMELHTDTAPKAVWNFVKLAQKGYYKDVAFHRNIPNFMIQGGDPSGTGRGGASIWGKYFDDEFDGPLTHNARGTVSMANKGKNTNSSQFFIAYKAVPHLDRKHTIFGTVVSGLDVLAQMEDVPTDGSQRPLHKIVIRNVAVFVDPFAAFQAQHQQQERDEARRLQVEREGGEEADKTTWTGKRIRADGSVEEAGGGDAVGKYLKTTTTPAAAAVDGDQGREEVPWTEPEPPRKKMRGTGGFGNFDGW
ncbi:peptidyl-prolyl cis-trans isomerase cyp8 [Cordyceps militaris CM01]|uniref:Peptidyl-prolyl cis-trans isomerase-like 2 n=2 Tax=Cordyceps militaris TaxID=73501 RepID=G3JH52_CORMM|nr:peptidyl-prolyl cis-trans isomerase cyp8 [Cordyceps militaris CM01]ATY58525.1 peptidyl-prolyl cis-trans isomerase cyp8 [Cordyceps militaris]EGX91608.1 peptidyl-prolyl cis-trans isomerase cyp8 [Cordyceps militaris CM01]